MKKIFNKIILFTLLSVFLMPLLVQGIKFENPILKNSIAEVITGIVDWVYDMALILAPLAIIIGAFYLITAVGDPDRINTGKKIIIWTIVGIAIVLLATSFKLVIENLLGGSTMP